MSTKETLSLAECLCDIEDPRKPSNGTRHNLQEMLVIAICATLSNVDKFDDIAFWARNKEDWLRRFLALKHGVPSQWTFLRLFGLLDPKQFEPIFLSHPVGIGEEITSSSTVGGLIFGAVAMIFATM